VHAFGLVTDKQFELYEKKTNDKPRLEHHEGPDSYRCFLEDPVEHFISGRDQ